MKIFPENNLVMVVPYLFEDMLLILHFLYNLSYCFFNTHIKFII